MSRAAHWQRRQQTIATEPTTVPQPVMRRAYPSDLTDSVWAQIAPILPRAKPRGRPYEHAKRDLVNAYCYLMRTGHGWRMLPKEFPPWQTVHWHVTQWRRAGVLNQLWNILDGASDE